VSYTIDSARHFRALFPDDQLYWIIGGDQLPKMNLWKDATELARADRVHLPGATRSSGQADS